MIDLSRPWPLGLGDKALVAAGRRRAVVLLGRRACRSTASFRSGRRAWPTPIRDALAQITPLRRVGLDPLSRRRVLFVVTALLALLVRWKLMRTMLWQFAGALRLHLRRRRAAEPGHDARQAHHRPRPADAFRRDRRCSGFTPNWCDWTYQSFPSGHATTAFALAAVVGFLSPRWFYPALALAAAIGAVAHHRGRALPQRRHRRRHRRRCSAPMPCAGCSRGAAGCSRRTPDGRIAHAADVVAEALPARSSGAVARQRRSQVGLEVVDALEPDMEPQHRPGLGPIASRCGSFRDGSAGRGSRSRPTTSPCANSSKPSTIAASAARGLGSSSTENTLPAPVKSRAKMAWSGWLGRAGWITRRDARLPLEPARHLGRARAVLLHPDRQRAQAARREEAVVGRGAEAEPHDACRLQRA